MKHYEITAQASLLASNKELTHKPCFLALILAKCVSEFHGLKFIVKCMLGKVEIVYLILCSSI